MNINKTLLAAILLFVLCSNAYADKIDRTLDAEADTTVVVDVKAGDIDIETWDKNQVRLVGEVYGDVSKLDFIGRADEVRIVSRGKNSFWGGYSDNGADFTIYAPKSASFRLNGASTSFKLKNVNSSVDVNTMSGDIYLQGGKGRIDLQSVSGNVRVRDAVGSMKLASVSGDIEVEGQAGDFDAQTVSGDIEAELGEVELIELESVSGDIEVSLILAPDARLDASTVSGNIDLEFRNKKLDVEFDLDTGPGGDIENRLSDHRPASKHSFSGSLEFQLGKGSASVEAETMSGTIRVDK